MKGHSTPSASKSNGRSKVSAACHPDPTKGRSCRHNQTMAETVGHKTASAGVDRATATESAE